MNKIFADFNNSDEHGRVRLNNHGTLNDLREKNIILEGDLKIILSDDDGLETKGIVRFSNEEDIWVAEIDWNVLKDISLKLGKGESKSV